jgi:hypothetical protein
MAKKKKRIKQRPAVGRLGKALTRRSRGLCELCTSKDSPRGFELVPFPEEPTMERSLVACARCRDWLENAHVVPVEAHFLCTAIWSEEPAVSLAAARLLLTADDPNNPWMRESLDAVDVDPATGEFR